jgi:membrane-associated phospholipid phosphatase
MALRGESALRRVARVSVATLASVWLAEAYLVEWATAGAVLGVNYGAGTRRTPVTLRHTAAAPLDPELLHPYTQNSVSGPVLFVLAFAVPAALVLFANAASAAPSAWPTPPSGCAGDRFDAAAVAVGTRDVAHFMLSLFEAYALASCWKIWLNYAVGRQRPDWYARLATGDAAVIDEGRMSYPSGHAAYTHASAAVCALYIAARLRVFAPGEAQRAQMARLLAAAAPLGVAAAVAASRLTDYRHHFSDVNAGALIGLLSGAACYHLNFEGHGRLIARRRAATGPVAAWAAKHMAEADAAETPKEDGCAAQELADVASA